MPSCLPSWFGPERESASRPAPQGTAIDQRLRLAFTAGAPVEQATLLWIESCRGLAPRFLFRRSRRRERDHWTALAEVGRDLVEEITTTVRAMRPDARRRPMMHTHDEEQRLARMLLVAAWYALNFRAPSAFPDIPLA